MKTQTEFEAELVDDLEDGCNDYAIFQVTPHCWPHQANIALVGDINSACEVWESLSDDVRKLIALDKSKTELEIYQRGDYCTAGYSNVYRGIKQLAPFVDDCRFFIAANYKYWVDDYVIRDHVLSVRRFYAPVVESGCRLEGASWMRAHLMQQAQANDLELRVTLADYFGQVMEGWLNGVFGSDQQEDQDRAQTNLDRSIGLHPPTLFVQLQLGRMHQVRGENAEAVACFEQAQESSNSETAADATLHLAALAARDDTTKCATDVATRLEQIDNYEALLLLAAIHRATNRKRATDYVNELVNKLVNRPNEKHEARSTILSPAVLAGINDLITDANCTPEQKAEFLSKVVQKIEEHVRKAPAMYLESADALLDKALTMQPSAALWYQRGVLHRRHCPSGAKGKQQALTHFKEAVRYGEHRAALLALAEQSRDTNQYSDAQGLYHRYFVASQQADSKGFGFNIYLWRGLFTYGECMFAQLEHRDGPEFIESLDYARFALDTFVPWFEPADPIVLIGDLLSFEQRYDDARELYDLMLAENPRSVQAVSHKASGYCNQKNFDEANRVLDDATNIDSTYWHIHYMRACITTLQDNLDDALEHLSKALVTMPDNCKAIVTLERDLAALRSDDRYKALMKQ